MKRYLFILLLPICLAVFTAPKVYAEVIGAFKGICHSAIEPNATTGEPGVTDTTNTAVCADTSGRNTITGSGGILMKAINLITFLTGVASIIIIILGGIKYVVSTGDPGKVASAKDTILYAVIGLVVSVSARGIILFIVNKVK